MTTNLIAQRDAFAETGEAESVTEQIAALFKALEPAHSAQNIGLWKSYLPNDCVKSMIDMGWDHST